MKTYTTSLSTYQGETENSSTLNTTYFNDHFNEKIRQILRKRKWPFMEKTKDIDTVASQQFYDNPYNLKDIKTVTVTVDNTKYSPKLCPTRQAWDKLNSSTDVSSDIPSWWFPFGNKFGLYPIPSTDDNTITVIYRPRVKNLSIVDYTTGTVTNTNGSKVITGAGTTFTAAMVGRWIELGDGEWYEIDSYTSATVIVLVNNFEGTTEVGASYTIGEVSILPEEYQMLPIYGTLADYFLKEKEFNQADRYENKFNDGITAMEEDLLFNVSDPNIEQTKGEEVINPNLYVTQ